MSKKLSLDTLCLTAGWSPKKGEPRQLPIYQSTTFKYETCEQMAMLFSLQAAGYFYSRLQNPTCDSVAAKIAALEGGAAAMLTSSGQSAIMYAVMNICNAGDHIVCTSALYGGSVNLIGTTLKKFGIEVTFVDQDASNNDIQKAFQPNTKAMYGETLANPKLSILDIERMAQIAHTNNVPLIIDNTMATPILCRPIEWGADIVVHSTTKYMDGHAAALGGAIVDGGNFDWAAAGDKFPGFNAPDPSYHDIVYSEVFGKGGAFIYKATLQLMRDMGACQAPQNAFLTNLGLETLHLRMARHSSNALAAAKFLKNHPKVAWVNYPGLDGDKYNILASKYMPLGASGVVAFGIKGGKDASIKVCDSMELISIVTHIADAKSCMLHPASTTHGQLTDEQLLAAGVQAELIRFSVGIEGEADLIADLEQALSKI